MKKWMYKITAIMFALMMTVTVSTTVKAETKDWHFATSSKGTLYTLTTGQKADAEKNWYISLDKSYGGKSNTMSSTNIFQCRTYNNATGNAVSGNHRFSNYVTGYKLAYNSNAGLKAKDKVKLKGGKDYKSTSTEELRISGRFTP